MGRFFVAALLALLLGSPGQAIAGPPWKLYGPLLAKNSWSAVEWYWWSYQAEELFKFISEVKPSIRSSEKVRLLNSTLVWLGNSLARVEPPTDAALDFDPTNPAHVKQLNALFAQRERELLLLLKLIKNPRLGRGIWPSDSEQEIRAVLVWTLSDSLARNRQAANLLRRSLGVIFGYFDI